MSDNYIRGRTGKILGRVDRNWIFDGKGTIVARFDASLNRTFDANGKFVGPNDQRLRVLGQRESQK